jgi:hypothetical protein
VAIVGLALGALAVATLALLGDGGESPGSDADRDGLPSRRLVMSGLAYQVTTAGGVLASVAFDRLEWRKRKFGTLSVNLVYELAVDGARLSFDRSEGQRQGARLSLDRSEEQRQGSSPRPDLDFGDLLSEVKVIGAMRGLGRITQVIVNKIEIEITGDGATWYVISADRARIASRSGDLDFPDGFQVWTRSGQRLSAPKGRWPRGAWSLEALGTYELRDESGAITTGPRSELVLDPSGTLVVQPG